MVHMRHWKRNKDVALYVIEMTEQTGLAMQVIGLQDRNDDNRDNSGSQSNAK